MWDDRGTFWTPRPLRRVWGRRRTVLVPNPAAGADWSYVAAAGFYASVVIGTALFTSSAEAGERFLALKITDGNETLWEQYTGTAVKASESQRLNLGYATDVAAGEAGHSTLGVPVPAVVLAPGWTIGTVTSGVKAGDQWSGVALSVEEFEIHPEHEWHEIMELAEKLIALREVMENAVTVS